MSRENRHIVTLKYPKLFLDAHNEAASYWEERISEEEYSDELREEMVSYHFYLDSKGRLDYDASCGDLFVFLASCEDCDVQEISINYDVNKECYIARIEDDYKEGEFELYFGSIAKDAGVEPFEVIKTGDFTFLDKLVWYPEQNIDKKN